jgi:hypothetical protein
MATTIIGFFRALILAVLLSTASALSANAAPVYLSNSFDTLTSLSANPNTFISTENIIVAEGTGAVRMTWNSLINSEGSFNWMLPGTFDLTDTVISFQAYTPSNISEVSLKLFDTSGKLAQSWSWNSSFYQFNQYNLLTAIEGDPFSGSSFVAGPGQISSINRITLGEIGADGVSFNLWDNTNIRPIPEPATLTLLAVGLCGLLRRSLVPAGK